MKTKVTFEKLNCDFWDLSELKEPFENGELYHKASGQFYRIKNRSDLSLDAIVGSGVYKLVETKATLKDELIELYESSDGIIYFEESFESGWLKVCCGTDCIASIGFETIHALSEILKRHGK